MRFSSDREDFVSLDRNHDASSTDLHLSISVQWRSFAGRVEVWILRQAWLDFCDQLTRLEAERRGSATVESMSPSELRLTIRSTDRAGHMAVDGQIGYRGVFGETLLLFAPIDVDPTILPQLVREAHEMCDGIA